jgi:hypothetical protein
MPLITIINGEVVTMHGGVPIRILKEKSDTEMNVYYAPCMRACPFLY